MKRSDERIPNVSELRSFVRNGAIRISHKAVELRSFVRYVYLFEFKRDKSAEEALKQIEDMGYAKPYAADERRLLKIGVNFNSKERSIDGWKVRGVDRQN